MSFKKKVILVTGASSGIGAAIAVQAARDGADVVMVGRNQAKLNKVSVECENIGNKPLVINADVSKDEDVKRIVDTTIETYKKLDVLVNNAGFFKNTSIESDTALEVYDSIMGINIRGVVYLTHLAARHLIKTKGNIVNISSIAAQRCTGGYWSYCTSKAALDQFSKCVASELAPKGVRVNVVSPGPVITGFALNMDLTEEMVEMIKTKITHMTALGRSSEPEEIADLVLFLASEKAKGITGSVYVVDNGVMVK